MAQRCPCDIGDSYVKPTGAFYRKECKNDTKRRGKG